MPGSTTRGYEYPTAGDDVGDLPAKVQEFAETVDAQLKRLESGTATTASFASGTSVDLAVAFAAAFTAAPKLIACIAANRNDPQLMSCTVKTVTTAGATLRVYQATGGAIAVPVNWIAHG